MRLRWSHYVFDQNNMTKSLCIHTPHQIGLWSQACCTSSKKIISYLIDRTEISCAKSIFSPTAPQQSLSVCVCLLCRAFLGGWRWLRVYICVSAWFVDTFSASHTQLVIFKCSGWTRNMWAVDIGSHLLTFGIWHDKYTAWLYCIHVLACLG